MSGRSFTVKELGFDPRKLGPDSPLRNVSPRSPRADGEHEEQVKLFTWARENETQIPELRWMFAVPNFSGRLGKAPPAAAKKHGARLKAEGRKPGVLDVWWPLRRPKPGYESHVGDYSGLCIEMKFGKNTLTDEQVEWRRWLESQGWVVEVCYTFERARDIALAYYEGGYRK